MLGLRHLPLRYRLPLIHGVLGGLARLRSGGWRKAYAGRPAGGDFVVSGFLSEPLGIGRAGRLTVAALKTAGYEVIEHDLRPAFRRILTGNARLPDGPGGVWLIHANAPETLIALLAHPPAQWANRYRIGYWAWETSQVPGDWLRAADYLHEIWVPSHYVQSALEAAMDAAGRYDLIPRIHRMPHPVPVSPVDPERRVRARQRFGLDPERCEVLSLFDTKSSAARKNPWGAIEAWQAAFPQPGEARLTVKVIDLHRDRATARRLDALLAQRPDIRLIDERLSDRDMSAFVSAFDILISLHRSEGFGLALAEAMAAGVAVIATAGSGNDDFMTAADSRPVNAQPVPIRDADGPYGHLEGVSGQVWGDPSVTEAAEALSELVTSKAARERLAAAGPEAIRALETPWRREALIALPFNAWL